jgi:predicted nucleic acid-binding protein
MTHWVLLDANILIGAFDGDPASEEHVRARERLQSMMDDPEVDLAITPLIRYEVLRGVRRKSPAAVDAALNYFQSFEICTEHGVRAAEIFRLAKDAGAGLDKRSFDLFHCVCAEINDMDVLSQDGDIPKIQQLIQDSRQNA